MRVLIAGPHPFASNRIGGGVQAVTHYLAQALANLPGVEVEVLTLNYESTKRTARLGNATVHYVPSPYLARGPIRNPVTARELSKIIRQIQPDIVNAHVAGLYARAAFLSGVPWVLTPHGVQSIEIQLHPGSQSRRYRYWKVRRIEIQAVRKAKHTISNSQFISEYLSRYLHGRVYHIDNPVADQFFDVANRSEHKRLLVVGKLIFRKGIHLLLDALPAVRESHPGVKVRFAGSTAAGIEPQAYWASIERQVAALGLADTVEFLGELDEPELMEEYARCCAVVSSASMETSAMGILQAMAVGRPVVATRVGGTPWVVEHGRTGLLVPPDEPAALAGALTELLADEGAMAQMGRQGKAVAESRCRANVVAEQTLAAYRNVIDDWKSH